MGMFSRNREYTFKNFDDFVINVLAEFDEGAEIDIIVPYEVVDKYIKAFVESDIKVYSIDYAIPEINGYCKEYIITLSHLGEDCLFVEPAYNEEHERYLSVYSCDNQITFVSADATMKFYEELIDSGLNTVLYEFE